MDDDAQPILDEYDPRARENQVGREDLEKDLRKKMARGALTAGYIIAGPNGAGKATLAYRIARGLLAPTSLSNELSFEMSSAERGFRLIARGAHPDLFIAERQWNEKTSRYQSEIPVETIRNLISFLSKTAAEGGYRVAIIDSADDLNRNAANALLKVLEEPPAKTLIMLLSEAPGRLLSTIRSRCRRIALRAVSEETIISLLTQECDIAHDEAARIAQHSNGRPGYALALAQGEGGEAITMADRFVAEARKGQSISWAVQNLSAKTNDAKWGVFKTALLQSISDAARTYATNETVTGPFSSADVNGLMIAHDSLSTLLERGEALNLDRQQLITALAYDLRMSLSLQV